MRKLFLLAGILLAPLMVFGTAYTATVTGSACTSTNFSPNGAPTAGDSVTVNAGVVIAECQNRSLGSNASNVGIALYVKGGIGNEGKWVENGFTLTLAGTDRTTNLCSKTDAYGNIDLAGGVIQSDLASDMQCGHIWNGRVKDSVGGGWLRVNPANVTWSTSSGTVTVPSTAFNRYFYNYDGTNSINIAKITLGSGALWDASPIANSGGSAQGSCGDTSFVPTIAVLTGVERCSLFALLSGNAGDWWLDYYLGNLLMKVASATGSWSGSYTFKYRVAPKFNVLMTANAAGSSIDFSNGVNIQDAGSLDFNWALEADGKGFIIQNKYAPTLNADRQVSLNNVTCEFTVGCLEFSTLNSDVTHRIPVSNITIKHAMSPLLSSGGSQTPVGSSGTGTHGSYNTAWSSGALMLEFANYLDFTNLSLNSTVPLFQSIGRPFGGTNTYTVTNVSGSIIDSSFLDPIASGSTVKNVNISAFGGIYDSSGLTVGGRAGNVANVFDNIVMAHPHRCARVDNYMTWQNGLRCSWDDHHGIVVQSALTNQYIDMSTSTFTKMILDNQNDQGNLAGCVSLSYNVNAWLRNLTYNHFTCNKGFRGIEFNDFETTVVLCTYCRAINGIVANSVRGIWNATPNSTNVVAFGGLFAGLDLYNNTNNNVTAAMFMRGGNEYIFGGGAANLTGVLPWGPSGYSLPDVTSRSLVQVNSGSPGSTYSLTEAWSGGAAQQYVVAQGTCNGSGNTTAVCGVTGTPFSTTGSGMKTYQVWMASGTNAGKFCMIISNTTSSFTCIAQTSTSLMPVANDSTTTFVIFKSTIALADSGATNTIQVTIDTPTLTTAAGTYTDSGITIQPGSISVDPGFLNAYGENYVPTNQALKGAALDGTDIGAVPVGIFPSPMLSNPVPN